MQHVALALAIVMLGSNAHADPERARAQRAMETYFEGEQRGGLILVGMGAAGLIAGGFLYRNDTDLTRGMAYPLLGIGIAHVGAGIFINVVSRRRIETFTPQITSDVSAFVGSERPRMKGVSTTLTVLKVAEVILIAGGLTMAGLAHRSDRKTLEGIGYGIAIEAGLTFGFDLLASRRASTYRHELDAVNVTTAHEAGGGRVVLLSHAGAF